MPIDPWKLIQTSATTANLIRTNPALPRDLCPCCDLNSESQPGFPSPASTPGHWKLQTDLTAAVLFGAQRNASSVSHRSNTSAHSAHRDISRQRSAKCRPGRREVAFSIEQSRRSPAQSGSVHSFVRRVQGTRTAPVANCVQMDPQAEQMVESLQS